MHQFKIAIIGSTGFAIERILPELEKSDKCKIVAVQGRNLEKIKVVAEQFNIERYYTDTKEMFESDVYDLVYIATPPYLHLDFIKECINSGKVKNILCEKPLVITKEELEEISQLQNSVPIYLGHHIRHQKAISDLKHILESKVIGDVTNVGGEWSYNLDPQAQYAEWKLDQLKGGPSVMGDSGVHVIDLVYLLFGSPTTIKSDGISKIHKTTYDNVTATLNYKDKQIVIRASQTSLDPQNNFLIVGTKGRIEIKDCFSQTYIKFIEVTTEARTATKTYEETFLYKNEVENILGIFNDGIPATTLPEAIEETKMLIEINDQLSLLT